MRTFKCSKCENVFDGEPIRQTYGHPIYGECERDICYCPECESISHVYTAPSGVVPIGPSFRKGRFKKYKLSNDQIL